MYNTNLQDKTVEDSDLSPQKKLLGLLPTVLENISCRLSP